MATTQISWNKLLNFKRLKNKLPNNSAADKMEEQQIIQI